MKSVRKTAALLLAAVLLLPPGARAAKYTDLPSGHWAYGEMNRAVSLGILTGMGEGVMAPEGTLTWGQYLVMLNRAFFPDAYAGALNAGLAWDQAGYWAAWDCGLLLEDDFLPVDAAGLSQPILRQDAAVLLSRVLPQEEDGEEDGFDFGWGWWYAPADPAESFSDWDSLAEPYQEAVEKLFQKYVIQGREDGTFGGGETIRRADGSVLLIRTMDAVDDELWGEEKTILLHVVDPSGTPLLDDQTVVAQIGRSVNSYVNEDLLWHYTSQSWESVSSFQDEYTAVYRPYTQLEADEEEFWDKVERGEALAEDYYLQDFLLNAPGENPRKYLLLFGDSGRRRYDSQAEAAAAMTTITVPVWHLDRGGGKVPATASLRINAAIAEDVTALFTEIYNDPEQFPIHDLGGYDWRGDDATGEHNCGTAIDINAGENYQVRDGKAIVGSYWKPGEDPFSISPDGSVVRIFAAHGWSWGGDAWAADVDASSGYHDYMHFSYMGM